MKEGLTWTTRLSTLSLPSLLLPYPNRCGGNDGQDPQGNTQVEPATGAPGSQAGGYTVGGCHLLVRCLVGHFVWVLPSLRRREESPPSTKWSFFAPLQMIYQSHCRIKTLKDSETFRVWFPQTCPETVKGMTSERVRLGASQILGNWDKPGGIRGDTPRASRAFPNFGTHPI